MIVLYDKFKTSDFDRNDLVLRNATKCEVTWEKNGQFQIDLVYLIIPGDTAWQSIVKGAIVKCPVPHMQDQLFRLNTPTKKMDENGTYFYVEATGYHITYDLAANFLEDVRPTGKTGIEAGEYILENTQYSHPFNWTSDIDTVGTAYYVRQNPIDALIGDKDNAYKNVWGGELVRDNFTIGMFNQAGENRGVTIRYSKNLTGFEQSADDSNMITRAMPYITDDSNSTDDSTTSTDSSITPVIALPERFIDSPKINDYANIYVKDVEVTLTDAQKTLNTDQKYQVMRDYVNNLYANSNVDVPVYSYSVNFLELCKTEEYKDYAVLEEVHPYDFVVIKALDIDVIAELVGYTYDSITKLYEEVTLGNVRNDIIRSNQKSLFQISQQNQNNIKILQAQMGDIPGTILNVATSTTSGGNNLFDHAVAEDKYLSEWITAGATVVEDDSLHDADKVWKLPPNTSLSKSDVLVNPNNYKNQQLMFSLQAKYNGLTITDNGQYNVPNQTNALLGALDAVIKRCLVDTTGTTWTFNNSNTGLISERIGVTAGTAITINNTQGYPYTIHAWDNKNNQLADFTTGPIPTNVFQISVEILQSISPLSLTGFSIFETNSYTAQAVSFLYANKTDCDWQVQEQNFQLMTEHPSDIIEQINFRASNGDANGTAYIAAFMINTGAVRSDFSQSSNDTVETLRAHQIVADYIQAKKADIDDLHATNATVQNLSATYATITNLNATNETVQNLTANVGKFADLTTGTLKAGIITADSAIIANGAIGNAQIANAAIQTANIALGAITTALIGTGAVGTEQVANESITDGKIVTLTANKLTAGTIDASYITVTNLDCANLTVGTINGQQIAPGAITATQLANGAVGTSQLTTTINNTINNAVSNASTALTNAQTALTTANGKNKTFYGSTTPTGMISGDLWMKPVTGGISPEQYNGSAWVSVTDVATTNAASAASTAQTAATNAATAASNAQSSVNNLQIGGTNLVPNGHADFGTTHWSADGTAEDPIRGNVFSKNNSATTENYLMSVPFKVLPNTMYTVQAVIGIDANATNINFYVLGSKVYHSDGTYDYVNGDFAPNAAPNTSYTKYTGTFTTASDQTYAFIRIDHNGSKTSGILSTLWATAIQLEQGNKATDWTPSLADTQDAGYLTTGTLSADRIAANTITGNKIAGNTILASNLVAGTLTSTSGVFGTIDASILNTGTLNANRIAGGSIDATKLVTGCITSASGVVGALDAGTITTGTLNANRIASSSITVDKLFIGDGANLAAVNEMTGAIASANQYSSNIISGGYITRSDNSTGYLMITNKTALAFSPNDQLYFEFLAVSDVSVNCNFTVWVYDTSGAYLMETDSAYFNIGTTESKVTGYITTPNYNPSTAGQFVAGINNIAGKNIKIRKVFLRHVTPGVLIQDGAITASKITASTITGDRIAGSTITAGNILANTITANQIAGQTITATQLASRTITADKIVANAITANEIAAQTITGNKISANTIVAGNIQANTITSTQIASNTITAGNLLSGTITATSACIGSLNATWLTTGTLNASLVNVTNINASNITTGQLSANHISGGTLTLGGSGNGNGLSLVKNASNQEVVRLDANGLTITLQQVSGGLLANAFNIKAYDGTSLMNIDGDGQLIYHGVIEVTSGTDNLTFDSRNLYFDNDTLNMGIGTGDGSDWNTYNAYIQCWDGLAFGSQAPYDGTTAFKPKILFNCRSGNIDTWGHLQVAGTKNRVVKTSSHGTRALSAYETAECYFGDIGRNKLVDGQCIINIDPIFMETSNTNSQYEIKTWAYGNGMVWVETSDMYPAYFIVHGTTDIEFGYEIIAKQLGYESDRLEIVNNM
ncbi:phage minor structural protein, N-terminal region [Clostridium acidisoli DSM 12555]|uniref:Phage minor structural protein, N-terminal region n=1 Tax=Clostridium acidisoli DSM 12555 TaxID=1121291 RepID=A0A1W1WZW3_9CLOT|nr:phage tail spike protein [Clostridium acidisoli]SMC17133.1 phage minor structural protein, N-terminal region [Clostridium acidisoli DSM 12555]